MNHSQPPGEVEAPASTRDGRPADEIAAYAEKLWSAICTRDAERKGASCIPCLEDALEREFHDASGQIEEMNYLGGGSIHFRDIFGSDFLAVIRPQGKGFSLSVERSVVTVREGVIDEPGDMIFASHHDLRPHPETLLIRETVEGSIEQAFHRILAMLNQLIEQSDEMSRERLGYRSTMRHLYFVDAGTLSYTSGIFGAALFMATSIGPGWLGFLASYLPMSILTAWAASAHE